MENKNQTNVIRSFNSNTFLTNLMPHIKIGAQNYQLDGYQLKSSTPAQFGGVKSSID